MQTIRIDFDNPGIPKYLNVMEDDAQTRFFAAELYRDGEPYSAPSGAVYSIMYNGPGPQNQGWYDTIEDSTGNRAACSVSGNVVTCEIAPQALHIPGRVTVVLCITGSNGYMLKGWPIECHCQSDRYDDTADVASYFYITRVTNANWTKAIQAIELMTSTIDASLAPYVTAARSAAEQAAMNEYSSRSSRDAAAASAAKSEESAGRAETAEKKTADIIARMENIKGGYCMSYDISIASDAWKMSDASMTAAGYPYQAELVDPVASSELEPIVTVLATSASVATSAGLCSQCETGKQKLSFWAKTKPTGEIKLHVMLFGKSTGSSTGTGEGMSDTEKTYVLSLFAQALYNGDNMQSIYNRLRELWGVEVIEPEPKPVPVKSIELNKTEISLRTGKSTAITATVLPSNATDKTVTWSVTPEGVVTFADGEITAVKVGDCTVTATAGGVSATCAVTVMAEPSSTSVPGETPVYQLSAAKTFTTSKQEFIDTGIKMFETIDPKPDWTILFEVQGGENAGVNQALLHCMDETDPWPGFTAHIVNGGYFQANIYGGKVSLAVLSDLKAEKARYAIRISGTKATRWLSDASSTEATISSYNTAVTQSLLIGCYQESDGTKGRFFDGTLYQCLIYHKALTNDQVKTWLTT